MTLAEWLRPRLEDVPASLRQRVLQAVDDAGEADSSDIADAAVRVARSLLDGILADEQRRDSRASALELLSADALVTHALEERSAHGDEVHASALRYINELAFMVDAGGTFPEPSPPVRSPQAPGSDS